jgi:FkbM family methyltransferase
MQKHFATFINKGDLVFDIGTYKGELSEIFLDLGASVICIEPQPKFAAKLRDKYVTNPNVTIIEKGVADCDGKLKLTICANSETNSTFSKNWQNHPRYDQRKWKKQIEVEVTTLQSLIDKYGRPSFCKIDVEGFEEKVIKSLEISIPSLSFEFDQECIDQTELCVKKLTSLGKCEFNYSKYDYYSLVSEKWYTYNQLLSELHLQMNGYLRGDIYVRFI